jgi:GTP cyclohydrolase I
MTEKNEETILLESYVASILNRLGLDLTDPNLTGTPSRIIKMLQTELLCNIGKRPGPNIIRSFPNDKKYDEIVLLDNIPFVSMCSHHFLPFPGLAWFAYVPDKQLIGASKPSRILDFFAAKPQLQENLASEVVD